ncbi:MAG TPA: transcription antitermination factor NusB [Anaeromyxobacteraceae bacterium]|nr:transcription antitermination factor NusB [Anaeromyxobacteraceae bacterium]
MNGRALAFEVLRRVEEGGAYASRALDAALARSVALDPREVGLATELVYGSLRRALALDLALARHAHRPLAEIDPAARVALRLGAYELLVLGRPPHAAVSEAVALAKSVQHGRAAGFVNAVLRSLARDPQPAPAPPFEADPAGHLAAAEALPRWLAEEWVAWFGPEEALLLARAMNAPAPLTLRSTTRDALVQRLAAHGIVAQACARSKAGLEVRGASVAAVGRAADGLPFCVQDEGSQLVVLFAAGHLRGESARVLDACAAPGGKAFHLSDLLGPGGEVVAVEIHPGKAERLREEAARRGLSERLRVVCADATKSIPSLSPQSFDAVLVDAPCTGLGTLRRHPELKLRRTAADPGRMAVTQRALLDACARLARPGAPVTYSVCSLSRAEGPLVTSAALERGLVRAKAPEDFPRDALTSEGELLTLPSRHGCDGFYAARFFAGSRPPRSVANSAPPS